MKPEVVRQGHEEMVDGEEVGKEVEDGQCEVQSRCALWGEW
jgi:hypothetical protein